jgi:two-component system, response regulator PdtaR
VSVSSGEKLRVLVAEDESIIRLDLVSLLERAGLEVCAQARDADEAVTMASITRPDVAILDVKMPCGGGIEAARRILAEQRLPIVMLTAFSEQRLVERAVEAGVFGYLAKPFREQDVVPALRAAVARHRDLVAGRLPEAPVTLDLPSSGSGTWPLKLTRNADGSVDVSVR